ncbi:HAD family hydrolase [Cerasibacillus sp. JNUCC 74]
MNKIRQVIFDMDGLLFDTERIAYKALKKAMGQAGYQLSMDIYSLVIGSGVQEEEKILQGVYGDDFSLSLVTENYLKEFQHIVETEGVGIMPGVHELLDILDELHIKKCVASSSSLTTIKHYLTMNELTDRFDFYMSGEEVERGKPNPDIFIEACHRAGEKPDTALVLEDSPNGLRAAYAAGIKCIVIPDLVSPNQEMKTKAYKIADSLFDVRDMFRRIKL